MRVFGPFARSFAGVAVVALCVGALFAACDAHVETQCFDGPCLVSTTTSTDTTSSTTDTTGTGTTTSTDTCKVVENGGDMCSDAPADGDFPCDVLTVLKAKCHICHDADHEGGAPIDLLSCSRFHEQDCGKIRTRFRTAQSYVCTNYMPQGAKKLTADEKKTVLDWLDSCAPCVAAGSGCSTGMTGVKACYK
jgi:hypothetical protein